MQKYKFSWDLISTGNINEARPNLGPTTRLENYRLMQFTLRDVLEQRYGAEETDDLFRAAGNMAGRSLYENMVGNAKDLGELVQKLQELLQDMSIGILRLEESDLEKGQFVLTVAEDLDCSGLPDTGHEVCIYDEGFLAGILEAYTGKKFHVREVDCWCTGDRTCRFKAQVV